MEDIIVTKDLTKEYRGYKANHAISMCVKKGSIYGLIGRNGAGKTTFMRMLLGLSKPTKGEIQLFGKKGNEMNLILYPFVINLQNIFLSSPFLF